MEENQMRTLHKLKLYGNWIETARVRLKQCCDSKRRF